jgi:Domain of unknown function (DUF222)
MLEPEPIHYAQLRPIDNGTLLTLDAVPDWLLSPEGQGLKLRMLDAVIAYVEAGKNELTVTIAGPKPPAPVAGRADDFAANEIAVASKCSVYAARDRIGFARDLSSRLVKTLEAMHNAEISWAQARALSEATCQLDVTIARDIEERVLRFSHRQDITLFRASLRRWLARLDPDFITKATAARKECQVSHTALQDGTGELYIRGPLEIATAVSPDTPKRHGRTPTVNITIDLLTLLGLRNYPAQIPGVGARDRRQPTDCVNLRSRSTPTTTDPDRRTATGTCLRQ